MRTMLDSTINPIGLRSKYVESLTSYLIRMAEAHRVPPGKLLKKVVSRYLPKNNLRSNLERGSFTSCSHQINYN